MRAAIATLFITIIITLAFQVCLMQYGRDQGIYAVVASVILDGGAPYKDAWDFKPPGIFFSYALARVVLGSPMYAPRILEAMALLSMVVAFVLLCRRIPVDWLTGIAAGAVALVYHVNLGFWETGQPESFGGPLVVWALVLAMRRSSDDTRGSRLKARGAWMTCAALFAVAALLKPPLGGGAVFAFAVVAVREWRTGPTAKRTRRVGVAALAFLAGGALVLGAVAVFLVARGAWADFQYTFFEYVPHYTGIRFSWGDFPSLLVHVFERWPTGPHPFVWAGVVLAVLPPRTHRRESEVLFLILGAAAVQIVGIAAQAKFFPYHYGAVLPLIALVSVWGYAKLWHYRKVRWALVVVAILGLHYVSVQRAVIDNSKLRLEALVNSEKSDQINDRLHTIHDVNAQANRIVAEWIAENAPDDLPIYVWGFEPVIYDRSNRRPASKYIYNVAQRSAWGRERARATLMQELTQSPPSVIVTLKRDAIPHVTGNKLDSAKSLETFPQLDRIIRERYTKVVYAEDLTVYMRNDLITGEVRGGRRR